jgi:N-acetylglucosaminyl-diphospho-decaprenol L-rhamnosyltransferase
MSLTSSGLVSVSIVSHGQLAMVNDLLSDIEKYCLSTPLEVVLTINIEEINKLDVNQYSYPIKTIKNDLPKGFGANHNQAFKAASGVYFCVLNPDVRLKFNPFPALVDVLQSSAAGVCAPLVVNSDDQLEESARRFPSPMRIFKKIVGSKKGSDYQISDELLFPDWVGGMFMLFRSTVYKQMHGFDERYFLYYEDVDICARLTNLGMQVVLCPASEVVHLAQRASHKSLKYLRWHISSMLRFFMTPAYWHLL